MDVELVEIRDFLAACPPFSALDADALDALPKKLAVRYLRRGSRFPPAEETQPCLYVIRKGAVERRTGAGVLLDRLCEGDLCDLACRHEADAAAGTAIEDTLLYLLPCPALAALRREHPALDAHFARSTAEHLRHGRVGLRPDAQQPASLLTLPVSAFVGRTPVCAAPSQSIRDAAQTMSAHDVSAMLVVDAGQLCGILTDRDLRRRCLAEGLAVDAPVSRMMTADVISIGPESAAFEALMLMTRRGIHHLPVVDAAGLRGLVSSTDLLRWQSANAVYLAGRVREARSLGDLVRASADLPELQLHMHANGATPGQVGQAVSSINDALTIRLIELAQSELGPPPVPFAWVACGSQGRHEQTVHADQDNALVFHDSFDAQRHAGYFAALARQTNDGLDACGFRYCPGQVMACNAAWRQPQQVWIETFRGWIHGADRTAAMLAANFLDMRTVYGEAVLLAPLREAIQVTCGRHEAFLARMVANALDHKPPLGFFRNFTLSTDGEHADAFDIKRGGLIPITDLARIHALAAGHAAVGTLARLRAAGGSAGLGGEAAEELEEAFEYFGSLRLRHQAGRIRRGFAPDNFISPRSLTSLERHHLKAAFAVVGRLQGVLARRYAEFLRP